MNEEQSIPSEKPAGGSKNSESANKISSSQQKIPEDKQAPEIKQPKTKNPEPETPIMEVQHKHHHDPPGHTEKLWKHYFFEFLMLFLAITLGFFVENRREHFIEGKREEAYAKSLYDDLKVDTAIIQRTYNEKTWAQAKLDSLQAILASGNIGPHNEMIYYFERFITQTDVFTCQDVTYQQLRSSGNFRYIENIGLYKKIANYYNLYTRYQQLAEAVFGDAQNLTEMESRLFHGADLASLNNMNAETFYNLFIRPERKFVPVVADKDALNFLAIKAANAKYSIMASSRFLLWLKEYATTLLASLKEEYHLK